MTAGGRQREIKRRRTVAGLTVGALGLLVIAIVAGGGKGSSSQHVRASQPSSSLRTQRQPALRISLAQTGTLPAAVQDAASVATGPESALLIGGIDRAEASVADILRLTSSGASRIGGLASPLHDASASYVGGAAYLFGGGVVSSYPQITRIGPPSGSALRAGSTFPAGRLPTPASDLATATLEGTVYIVGGYTGSTPLRTILAWRPGQTAHVVGMLPKPLRYPAVGASDGAIVIAGGTSGEAASSDVYRFDPRSGAVTSIGRLPAPLTHAAAVSLGGDVLVFGGRGSTEGTQTSSILSISPAGKVQAVGALPTPLSDLAAVRLAGGIVLAGGRDRTGGLHDAILTATVTSTVTSR